MRIVITGVPGTGKTEVAKALAAILNCDYISLTDLIEKHKLYTVTPEGEKEVDLKKVRDMIMDEFLGLKNDFVVEGHLACEVVIPADYVFVLRTHPDVLRKRLKTRKYSKKKIEENIEAELIDYCVQRVKQTYLWRPVEIDTTKLDAQRTASRIDDIIKYKRRVGDYVSYSEELKKKLRLKSHGKRKKVR